MIKPLPSHYSMSSAPSVVDEEAMTALELAGRTVGKVNECVDYINNAVDKLPEDVENAVNEHIEDGDFDDAIDMYAGELSKRIVTLENNYTPGGTTADAALYDIKLDANGKTHSTPGDAIRANQIKEVGVISDGDLDTYLTPNTRYIVTGGINRPVELSGLLEVKAFKSYASTPTPWIVQTYDLTGAKGGSYYRVCYEGEWRPWVINHSRFEKDNMLYITSNLADYTENVYGIAAANVQGAPEPDVALFECQRYASTDKLTYWTRQTWTGIESGRVYERILKPNGVFTAWKPLSASSGNKHLLSGKRVVFFGDSIFANNQTETGIVKRFAEMTGAICYNFAFGGTRLVPRDETSPWSKFDAYNLSIAINTGDFTPQENALKEATDFPAYFANTLNAIKAFDFNTADYVIINWGANDWANNENPGTYNNEMINVVSNILSFAKNAIVIRVTPTQRGMINEAEDRFDGGDIPNGNDMTLFEFITETTMYNVWSIQIIDAFNIGINVDNFDLYLEDGVHHNARGCERVARFLAGSIM